MKDLGFRLGDTTLKENRSYVSKDASKSIQSCNSKVE